MASHGTPVKVEPWPRWIRAFLEGDGRPVVDSKRVLLVIEPRALPVFYLPRQDVRIELLIPNGHTKESPHLGQATLFDLITKDRKVEDAAWTYERPPAELAALDDHVAFGWDAIDHWF